MILRDVMRTLSPGRRNGRNLSCEEAEQAFDCVLSGDESEIAIAAFLVAMRAKGVTMEEFMGFARSARKRATFPCEGMTDLVCVCPDHDGRDHRPPLEAGAGLLAAAAGARVLIITDRCVPPKRGLTPASVFEELGGGITWDPKEAEAWIQRTGFATIALPGMLPALLRLRKIRGEVAVRTPLSTIEKLFAPTSAAVVVGAQDGPVLGVAVEVLQGLGHTRAIAIQGYEGSTVPSLKRRTRGIQLDGKNLVPLNVEPADFGLNNEFEADLPIYGPPEEGTGTGDNAVLRKACADITVAVLAGEMGPARNATLLGAAVILKASGRCLTLAEGVDAATSALDSGRARKLLRRVCKLT